jgi:hypothetical protein
MYHNFSNFCVSAHLFLEYTEIAQPMYLQQAGIHMYKFNVSYSTFLLVMVEGGGGITHLGSGHDYDIQCYFLF